MGNGNLRLKNKKGFRSPKIVVLVRKPETEYKNMGINQHVVRREGGWAVIGEGNSRDTSVHNTQQEAIDRGREIAINQGSELIVHGHDGKIREKNSYGNDPFPPRG
jgi:hypothetical protein